MAAVQQTIDQVKRIDVDQYKYGFETTIEFGEGAAGPERGHRPLHLGEEGRARLDAGVAARGLPALADHDRAGLGQGALPQDRLPEPLLLLGAEIDRRPQEPRRCRPGAAAHLREARHPAQGARDPGRREGVARGGRCGVRFRLRGHHLQGRAGQGRRHLLLDLGSAARASRAGAASTWARSCRRATTSMRRSIRRCSPTARSSTCRRACAARWSSPPTSASTTRRRASSSARSSSPTRAPT